MRNLKSILMLLTVTTGLLLPSAAFAAKKYQATGKVIALDDKSITVQKADDEKWEFERTAVTKIEGTLKIGEKVTIEYKMVADNVEVKKAK